MMKKRNKNKSQIHEHKDLDVTSTHNPISHNNIEIQIPSHDSLPQPQESLVVLESRNKQSNQEKSENNNGDDDEEQQKKLTIIRSTQCRNCHIPLVGTNQEIQLHQLHCARMRFQQAIQSLLIMHRDQSYNRNQFEVEYKYKYQKVDGQGMWKKEQLPKPIKIKIQQLKKKNILQVRKLSIIQKKAWFDYKMKKKAIKQTYAIDLLIRRQHLFEDSYNQFVTTSDFNPFKQIRINFENQPAQDIGGVMRDWFSFLMIQIFKKNSNFFTSDESGLYRINAESQQIEDYKRKFQFIGTLFGKALFERIPIIAPLSPILVKMLLHVNGKLKLEDMKHYDNQIYKSLLVIGKESVEGLDWKFAVDKNGKVKELVEGGFDIEVNDSNKNQFIEKMVDYYIKKQCQEQIRSLRKGLFSVVDKDYLKVFRLQEFQLILSGFQFIDVQDWKKNSFYLGEYGENHKVIIWFWQCLQQMNQIQRKKFLQFCTGLSTVPIQGFANLKSHNNKTAKFSISPVQYVTDELTTIKAHTCFNRIELPKYISKEILVNNIKGIINVHQHFRFDFE